MEIFDSIGFNRFSKESIDELTSIMKRAFDADTKLHLGIEAGGPTGYDNGDYIRRWYFGDDKDAYCIYQGDQLIGGICISIGGNGENHLINIVIDPLCHNKGVGIIVWKYIEQKYPDTKVWKTETPGYSKRNHHFYVNKCGFKIVKINNPKDKINECYVLEKEMK